MNEDAIIEIIAKSSVGNDLVKYLKAKEIEYADIRNLKGVPAETRIEALKILREILLDKLLILSGEIEPPASDDYN